MNDRFKFRVWNNGEQCVDHQHPDEPLIDCLRGVAMYYNGFANGNLELDNVTIEQCTGLKDRNGTLIYEGDIVYKICSWGAYGGVVKFNDASWELHTFDGNVFHIVNDIDITTHTIDGNIHENPELLEAPNE